VTPEKTPKHLWAGDWQEGREAPAGQDPTQVHPTVPQEPVPAAAPTAARRRFPTRAAVGGFGLGAIVVAGALALSSSGGDDTKQASSTAATLPAVASPAAKGGASSSRAGAIYASASPAVVSIRTGNGSGTGFLIDTSGTIVTNAHVVETANNVEVHFGESGDAIEGEVMGVDASSDLAVVHIDGGRIPSGTKPLGLADSDQVTVGETVVAIGNPFGLDRTLTEGIVSAIGRDIQAPNGFQISQAIQTDAAINPGNSGGPLLNDAGNVIGVNSQIETSGGSSGNVGVGFAVPSNTVRRIVPILQDGGTVQHAWLGVSMSDATTGDGAQVEQVVSGSPAADTDLQVGDVITGIDDKSVADGSALGQIIEGHSPGDEITLHVKRGGSSVDIKVALRTRPAQAP
jgi:putative serine protease PepD